MGYKELLTKEYLIEQYKSKTAQELSQILGCNPVTLARYNKKFGINIKGHGGTKPLSELFYDKIDKTPGFGPNGDCWRWTGVINNYEGYGQCFYQKRRMHAHRASFIVYRGEIPQGMCVCHRCDNRLCVNPEHLFLGTSTDNNKDRHQKGRSRGPKKENHGRHKLTQIEVNEIRQKFSKGQSTKLAKEYKVHNSTILRIVKNEIWKI